MIAAEELDMDISQMRWINVDTNVTPDTGGTYGEQLDQDRRPAGARGRRVRQASAARPRCDATRRSGLRASASASGVVSGGGKTVTYGQLIGDKLFNTTMGAKTLDPAPVAGEDGELTTSSSAQARRGSTSPTR